jgi:hypothetical protein
MLLDGLKAAAETQTWSSIPHAAILLNVSNYNVGIAEAVRVWRNCDPVYSRNMLQLWYFNGIIVYYNIVHFVGAVLHKNRDVSKLSVHVKCLLTLYYSKQT